MRELDVPEPTNHKVKKVEAAMCPSSARLAPLCVEFFDSISACGSSYMIVSACLNLHRLHLMKYSSRMFANRLLTKLRPRMS